MRRLLILTCLLLALALLALPAAAGAKSPPRGKYECVIGSTFFGTITIKSGSTYRRNGKTGRYKAGSKRVSFSDGRRGYRLTFKTGSFKGYKGRWYKSTTSNIYELALKNPIDGFESIYCDK
jgi:hypothetical protein